MNSLTYLYALTANEKWATGGMTTLIGLGMTFVMLVLLIAMIHLLRVVLKVLEKNLPQLKTKFEKKKNNSKIENIENTETVNNVLNEEKSQIDDDTMNVIKKTVSQYVAQSANDGKPHNKIKIVSVKEVANE